MPNYKPRMHKRREKRVTSLEHCGWTECGSIKHDKYLTDNWNHPDMCRNCLHSKPKGGEDE